MWTPAFPKPHHNVSQPRYIRTAAAPRAPWRQISPLAAPAALLQRQPACACGGACPRCQEDAGLHSTLTLGAPDDQYEEEADHIAEQVLPMPESGMQRQVDPAEAQAAAIQKQTSSQAMTSLDHAKDGPGAASLVQAVLQSPAQPLDASTRAFMESRLGYDLSHVRLHTDALAAASARAVYARAFTLGQDVVFGAGQYTPHTERGRRLLAHELTHVLQQTGGSAPWVQRQPDEPLIPIPVFDELDICVIVEGRSVCGSDARKACEKVPSIPGCSVFGKQAKKEGGKTTCPPGFTLGTARGFEGTCCQGSVHNERNCCTPDRIVVNATSPRCCPAGTMPDVESKTCVTPTTTVCPPDQPASLSTCLCVPLERQNLLKGLCCPAGQIGSSGECVTPKEEPPEEPPKPPVIPTLSSVEIFFQLDKPALGAAETTALSTSLTSEGKNILATLVKQLQQNPLLKVQLVGRASPEGSPEYNLDLGRRRAEFIGQALAAEGIDATRIANPPGNDLRPECQEVRQGVFTCGEAGATGPNDRQVLARVF